MEITPVSGSVLGGNQHTGFSTLCEAHKKALRRHGEATQTGVTVHQLRPYMARVVARQAKNQDNQSWAILRARWAACVADARRDIEVAEAGAAFVRHHLDASLQVAHLGTSVEPDEVMRVALAMFQYREDQPRRFRSDRAFDFQLARRVRGLSTQNAGSYWDDKMKRSKRVYKDMSPRVVEVLAGTLKDAFGLAGLMLARREQVEMEQARDAGRHLAEALEALQ